MMPSRVKAWRRPWVMARLWGSWSPEAKRCHETEVASGVSGLVIQTSPSMVQRAARPSGKQASPLRRTLRCHGLGNGSGMRSATRGASGFPDWMGSVTGESHARVMSGPDHVALSGTGLEVRMEVEPSACFWRTAGPRGVRVDSHESVSLRVPDETWRRRELSASEMDDQRDGGGGGVAERSGRSFPLGTGR